MDNSPSFLQFQFFDHTGLANGFLQRNNIDPTVGLRFRF
jgi:hypothetical protein